MEHFPAFMDIQGRQTLVIGGGAVASRKAGMLRRAGGRVTVVAPALCPRLADEVAAGEITHRAETFDARHLDGAVLVIAATDDASVNARVSRHARLRGLPVNVVDNPKLSSFIMPAVIDRAPVTVAISTGGASPVLARWVRGRIESALPHALGRIATLAGRYRDAARRRFPDITRRRRFWESLFDGPVASLALDGRDGDAEAALRRAFKDAGTEQGEVFLVGAGPGDPELLTIKALRALQSADVIVHDRLVSPEVLDLARRDAERIFVGKRPGHHTMTQDAINELLIRLARDGDRVVRLKGGDPFVFGRGGEEMQALSEAGIVCHLIPGITAAMGCAAEAGIPLTHRDYAQSCVFVTGHGPAGLPGEDKAGLPGEDENGLPDLDWRVLAISNQTLVIYMGLANLPEIARRLVAHGLAASTPAAVIANGTTPDSITVTGTLGDIDVRARASGITALALVIVGDVVRLARTNSAMVSTKAESAA